MTEGDPVSTLAMPVVLRKATYNPTVKETQSEYRLRDWLSVGPGRGRKGEEEGAPSGP